MRSLAWLASMLARGLLRLARRFAGIVEGMPGKLAGFAGGVAVFDGGLTGYAGFGRCARYVRFIGCTRFVL